MFKTAKYLFAIIVLCLIVMLAACTAPNVEQTVPSEIGTAAPATPQVAQTTESSKTTTTPAATEQPVESTSFLATANKTIQSVLEILVGLVITILVIYLVWRTIAESRRYRIEFDELQNGTGDSGIKDSLDGMESLVREKLISQIHGLKDAIDSYAVRVAEGATFPTKLPLPEEAQSGEALDKVVEALGAESPKYVKPLLYLYRYLFPQRGMRVKMTFQHDGNSPGRIGITFEFFDLRNQQRSKVCTLWDVDPIKVKIQPWVLCETADASSTNPQKGKTAQPPTNDDPLWHFHVAQALERASLYQDAITYYEKTLAEDESNHKASEGLVACQNKLSRQAGPASAFAVAAGLEKSGLLETAVESYAYIFTEKQDIDFARQNWEIATGLKNGSKGPAFYKLAEIYFKTLDLHDEAIGLYKLAVQEGSPQAAKALIRIQNAQADELVAAGNLLIQNEQWVAAETYLAKAVANVPGHTGAVQSQIDLKEKAPAQEDQEALAAFELGKLYQAQGIMSVAKEHLEKALEKRPDYDEAKETLKEVLGQSLSLRSRLEGFLDIALFWLAIELFRLETDRIKNEAALSEYRQAQYHNFYGAYLLAYYEAYPTFLEFAEKDFRDAMKACPEWLQPYENLGDMYSLQAMNQEDGELARRTLEKAIACYEIASLKKSLGPSGELTNITPRIASRIKLDQHLADLLRCPEKPDPLWVVIRNIEKEVHTENQDLDQVPIMKEYEEVYLSLAFWYALVAYRYKKTNKPCGCPEPDQAKAWACFYLACAVFLEPDRMNEAEYNPIIPEIIKAEQLRKLANLIEIKQFHEEALITKKVFNWNDVRDTLVAAGVTPPDNPKEGVTDD